jgi:hypothetical protein
MSAGIRQAIETARAAAGGKDVVVMGADIAQQSLAEGLVDEVLLHVVPLLLGEGIRLGWLPAGLRSPPPRESGEPRTVPADVLLPSTACR